MRSEEFLAFRYVRNFFFFLFGVGLGDWENSNRNEETVAKNRLGYRGEAREKARRNAITATLF